MKPRKSWDEPRAPVSYGLLKPPEYDIFLPELLVQNGVKRLARKIEDGIAPTHPTQPIILAGVLDAAVYLLTDLSRELKINHELDFWITPLEGSKRGLKRMGVG